MSRKRKVEAWTVVDHYNNITGGVYGSKSVAVKISKEFPEEGERVARLVEHSASADAVVRAAVRHRREHWHGAETTTPCTLCVAVERHLNGRKR